ncbi:MAG: 3-hydroxybutyryl-CoA dehydrogenase [Acidobacteria bacterium RIFCSPHIGHO2_12_FULL_67_30]|nr:MAG: 3-hydroxybutyryl-CoA dehydrogenase [Acidobacteria bacterium RIFCSPHIGHO2_01_FULL_67_28]OFV89130.1 MAG: 3-hydroxybutyryl-CoA dehydrogenase [Acidobacteria bacterium RIFCSPHIGHO2_12_FULL_67_30]
MDIQVVGVVGCGLMGSGITQVAAMSGFSVVVREVNDQLLDKGMGIIEKSLQKFVEKNQLSEVEKKNTLSRIKRTTAVSDLKNCDLVIEAVTENPKLKKELFAELDKLCPKHTVLASNTSSISITEMAAATGRPERFIGLHFMNPVPLMKLVEVIRTIQTADEVFETGVQFAEKLGKVPVRTWDRVGFIVNRLLIPYLLDSIRALEQGFGSIPDIDKSIHLGLNHPMGPFTLLDFVGLDTTLFIAEIMFDEYREPRFAPPPLLKRLVTAGWNGRKSGRGFYDYADPKNPKPMNLQLT